jgi:tetratricopeptide (TPR) repeat protein
MSDRDSRKPRPDSGRGAAKRPTASGRAKKLDSESERPAWQALVERKRDPDREKSPIIPDAITPNDLDIGVRVQLKTLTPENAEMVARHLAMVSLLIDQDPALAHKHALAAARRAGRIALVRETVGVTAYAVGEYALALRELLAHRRISGSNDQIPLIVDSERGMNRADRALKMAREVDRKSLSPSVRVNLAIASSGARLDLGENELALAELEIPELNPAKVFDYSPALFRAYADTLEILGRQQDAKKWFDLAERAERAVAGPSEDVLEVIEEIEIPKFTDRPKPLEGSRDGKAPFEKRSFQKNNFDKTRRGFDNPGGERRGAPRGR